MANKSGKSDTSLGDLIKSLICAFAAGTVIATIVLYYEYNSADVIFGASRVLTIAFVFGICWFSCCIAEALAKSSAQEALTDALISLVVAFLFVKDGEFLVAKNQIGSVIHILAPLAVTLVIAASLSYYITKFFSLIMGLKPFKNRDKSKSSEGDK
jgi:hypothetical protein